MAGFNNIIGEMTEICKKERNRSIGQEKIENHCFMSSTFSERKSFYIERWSDCDVKVNYPSLRWANPKTDP